MLATESNADATDNFSANSPSALIRYHPLRSHPLIRYPSVAKMRAIALYLILETIVARSPGNDPYHSR